MQAAALLQVLITLLPTIQIGVGEFIAWMHAVRTAAIQSGEWSPEQDATFQAACYAKTSDPAYLPDPPK